MLISKRLIKELRKGGVYILLDDGKDENGKPKLVSREVQGIWGNCDPFKGGVCFDRLSDGNTHICYDSVLGYNTGREACVQQLLLMEYAYTFSAIPNTEWQSFVQVSTQALLDARPVENPKITVEALTNIRYWFRDSWAGNIYSFIRLNHAKRYAERQCGTSVTIYTAIKGYTEIACIATASGYWPP